MPKRRFFDAYVHLPIPSGEGISIKELEEKIVLLSEKCRESGYKGCIYTIQVRDKQRISRKYLRSIYNFIRKSEKLDKNTVHGLRIEIIEQNQQKILNYIRSLRAYADIISIAGINRGILALGSRDRRVDVVTLIPGITPQIFRGDISYALSLNKFFELQLYHLLKKDIIKTARAIDFARTLINPLAKKKVNLLVSTGPFEPYSPRNPKNVVAFMKKFFDLPEDYVVKNMSEKIEYLITKNRLKLEKKIPVNGVYIEEN